MSHTIQITKKHKLEIDAEELPNVLRHNTEIPLDCKITFEVREFRPTPGKLPQVRLEDFQMVTITWEEESEEEGDI